jgi:ferredoxin
MKTIQITEQVVPDPRRYRLACMARVRGTVRLRKLN